MDRTLQTAVAHVDQCECCLAVGIEALKHLLEKLLAPLDELGDVILVDEQVLSEKRIAQTSRRFRDKAMMARNILKVRLNLGSEGASGLS